MNTSTKALVEARDLWQQGVREFDIILRERDGTIARDVRDLRPTDLNDLLDRIGMALMRGGPLGLIVDVKPRAS